MAAFALHIKKKSTLIAETYYEVKSEDVITEEQVKELEAKVNALKGEKAETNEGYNTSKQSQRFAQAYKLIAPPKDYVPKELESSEYNLPNTADSYYDDSNKLQREELERFNKAKEILDQQQDKGGNSKSTMHYSLVDRHHLYLPTPIYLCENGGKIVVNITVNNKGDVTDASVNNSYTSADECLKEHAIGYAQKARFNSDASKSEQLGTISFYFIGKQ